MTDGNKVLYYYHSFVCNFIIYSIFEFTLLYIHDILFFFFFFERRYSIILKLLCFEQILILNLIAIMCSLYKTLLC